MEWQPIETAPESEPILVWADNLHRGIPSAEVVVVVCSEGEMTFWTNGGPNAGDDLFFETSPTHWMPLPAPPTV